MEGGDAGSSEWKEPQVWKTLREEFPQLCIHPQTAQLRCLTTTIINKDTEPSEWIFYADRINRLIVEFALNQLPIQASSVTSTVDDEVVDGVSFVKSGLVGCSIIRAGEAMEAALRSCCRNVRIGKILIQRNESTAQPMFYMAKLPRDIQHRFILLLDPMLATGGSALVAIEKLLEAGAQEKNIIFVNVVATPEGIRKLLSVHPQIKFCTTNVAVGLNAKSYIRGSLGDYGDRYVAYMLLLFRLHLTNLFTVRRYFGTGSYWN